MEGICNNFQSKTNVGMSTIVVVKNRCQFCYAFFKDPEKIVEHSQRCDFRFAETFEAFDGKVKFACAVCFDVFPTRADHNAHELLHKYPGGFPCSVCDDVFLNEVECVQHMESAHEVLRTDEHGRVSASTCFECGAFFEQESFLRLHIETNCGRHRTWNCIQCSPNLLTKDVLAAHIELQHPSNCDEDDSFVVPKVEVTLIEDENMSSSANFVDPLDVVLKDGNSIFVDAQHSRNILLDEDKEEPPIEKVYDENPLNQSHASSSGAYIPRIGLGEKYECKYCDKRYVSKSCLDEHIVLHGSDGSLLHKCECCPLYFKTIKDRITHTKTAHKEEVTCTVCEKSFRNAKLLQKHTSRGCPKEHETDVSLENDRRVGSQESSTDGARQQRRTSDESMSSDGENERIGERNRKRKQPPKRPVHQQHEKKFECHYCGLKYFAESRLKRHIIDHGPDGSLRHKCEFCVSYFKTAEERDAHIAAEHNEIVVCDLCDKSFRSSKSLQWHNYICHKDRADIERPPAKRVKDAEFKCKYCGKKYIKKKGLDLHILEHGPDGSLVYRCEFYCPIYFKTQEENMAHMNSVHQDRLTCNYCGKLFQRPNAVYACQRSHRTGPVEKQTFVCAKCGMSFGNKTYLNNHELSDCGRIPIYKCDECGKTLAAKHSLKKHMMMHTGERNFPCSFCDMRLTDKISLRTHIRYKHTGERPFKCDQCDKRFVDKPSLRTHTVVHTGVKRYVCYGCGDRFPSNSSLHKHRNVRKDTCALVPIQPPLPLTEGGS